MVSGLSLYILSAESVNLPPGSSNQVRPWHHLKKGFRNPEGSPVFKRDSSDWLSFFWKMSRGEREKSVFPAGHKLEAKSAREGLQKLAGKNRLTWIGHAGFLVGLGGKNILTDPFFSKRASPVSFRGPQRRFSPGLAIAELPPIHAIVISHNHYDHMDMAALKKIAVRNPGAILVVPLKQGKLGRKAGFNRVVELDWYQSIKLDKLEIQALPTIHNSNRGLFDNNQALWAGYALKGGGKSVYFAGDTGYGPVFKEIGRKVGPFDLALVPIGAYNPRHLMQEMHVNPLEALKIAADVGAKRAVGMHWGTIRLTLGRHD